MKSFKKFIIENEKKESFKQDDKGRWIIPPNPNYGNRKDKLKEAILFEVYHTPTTEKELDYSNVDDYRDLNSLLNAHHNGESSNWKFDDISNINYYTQGSGSIADSLHNFTDGSISKDEIANTRDRINGIDNALKVAKPAPFNYHVYHGLHFNPQDLIDQQDESKRSSMGKISARLKDSDDDSAVMHLPAYTSTSLNARIGRHFAVSDKNGIRHVLKFHIPMGSNFGAHIDAHSNYGTSEISDPEYETLLKRGTNIKMSKTPEVLGNTHIWHCEIVGQDPKDINPKVSRYASNEELHDLSKSDDPEVRNEVASHSNTSADTLHRMAMDNPNDENLLKNIAKNRNTKTHTLNHLSDMGNDEINKHIVHNDNVDSHILNKLSGPSSSAPLLQRIASHPKTQLSTLNDIHNHSGHRLGVSSSLASNINSDDELLHKIALNSGKATHEFLINNKNTSNKTLHHIVDNNENYPKDSFGNFHSGILSHQNADPSLIHKIYDKNKDNTDYGVIPSLISSKHADTAFLHKVASDHSTVPIIRQKIAVHDNADDSLREKMYEASKNSPTAKIHHDNFKEKMILSGNTHTNLLHKMIDDDPNFASSYGSIFMKHKNADDKLKNRIKELQNPEPKVNNPNIDSTDSNYTNEKISNDLKGKALMGETNKDENLAIVKSRHPSALLPQQYLAYNHINGNLESPLKNLHITHILNNPNSAFAHSTLAKGHNDGHINLNAAHVGKLKLLGHDVLE